MRDRVLVVGISISISVAFGLSRRGETKEIRS